MARKIIYNDSRFTFFRDALGGIESGGNYGAKSPSGYLGKYQFGEPLLIDIGYYTYQGDNTKNINDWVGEWAGKDDINSSQDFLNFPTVQDKAFEKGIELQWRYIERRGLDKYIDREIGGIKITEAGLLAAA